MNKKKGFLDYLKRFWKYLWHDDSLGSYVLNFIFAFIFIKYLFFPTIGFLLNNDYPMVAIVSGSMEHKIVNHNVCDKNVVDTQNKNLNFDEWWSLCGTYYEKINITKADFKDFDYSGGLNIGDMMVLYGKDPKNIEVGEILVFIPQDRNFFVQKGPVIHRVVDKWENENDGKFYFATKGDHNSEIFKDFENNISSDNVIAVGVVRIPYMGYVKIMFTKLVSYVTGG